MKFVTDPKKLRLVSKNVRLDDFKIHHDWLQSIIAEKEGKLQGCSAIQYGQPVRAFAMRDPRTKEFSYIFNPEVLWTFGKRPSVEGCLSIVGRYLVMRPLFVKATWQDEDYMQHTRILGPKRSRIFMHEMDHLNGKTIKSEGIGGFKC